MRRRLSLGLLCLTLAACARQADIIVTGGMVWTGLSNGAPQKGAVALANGKILAVGDSAQIARYAGPKTQAIQADGGLVLPGFTDGHTHFIDGGFQLASVDLRNAATPKEFIRRDRKSTRLNSSHTVISYAVFCLKKKKKKESRQTN